MANEAVQVEGPYEVHDMTVATGTAIPQFTLLKMSDPRTGAASAADGDIFAGITMTEKTATDGVINLGAAFTGIFILTDSGAGIAVGARVSLGGANIIKTATEAEVALGKDFGVALEAIGAGTTGEVKVWQ